MRDIGDPGFTADDGTADDGTADDGSADETVRAALATAVAGGHTGHGLAVLLRSRVLVPVLAKPGETTEMAAALLTGRDGRPGLLAFTGTDSLTAWDPDARPVPVSLRVAAQAALAEGAAAVVVDIAGPAMFVVEGDDLRQTAAGCQLMRVGDGYGWVRPFAGDGSTGPV